MLRQTFGSKCHLVLIGQLIQHEEANIVAG